MTITLEHYFFISALVFAIGMAGIVVNRHNLVVLLMSIELMLLAVNTNFIALSHYFHDLSGQIFVLFVLAIAAAETAIGLAILMVYFRQRRTVDVSKMDTLHG